MAARLKNTESGRLFINLVPVSPAVAAFIKCNLRLIKMSAAKLFYVAAAPVGVGNGMKGGHMTSVTSTTASFI